jgi:hypothetical protein
VSENTGFYKCIRKYSIVPTALENIQNTIRRESTVVTTVVLRLGETDR